LSPDRFDLRPIDGAVLQGIGRVALLDVVRADRAASSSRA
jgi:hypothetical protein